MSIYEEIEEELARSKELHQDQFNSTMELLGVLTEEYEEVKDELKATKTSKPSPAELMKLKIELIQLAAMCVKGVESFCENPPQGASAITKQP